MDMSPRAQSGLAGRVLANQFRLDALLGSGGMGDVYLAEQLELGRKVVIKLLRSQHWLSGEAEERFRREARALAQLNHPNIVQLYSFGRSEDGITYLAMEYIEGRTLSAAISKDGAMSEAQVFRILEQLCSALIEAHRCGLVHRDLKPDNVMIMERYGQPAFVKVLDFGIAKWKHDTDKRLTQSGAIVGTPQYMSPEQLRERAVDERTDIYGVGLIAYELLTGKVPFEADNTLDLMMRVLGDELVPPSRKVSGVRVSPATEALIARCLAKDPSDRYQSATELRDALAALSRGEPMIERPRSRSPYQPSVAPKPPPPAAPSLALDERDLHRTEARYTPPGRTRGILVALAVLVGVGLAGVAAVTWIASLAKDPEPYVGPDGSLAVGEWIQGIPFPAGTEYDNFAARSIDARVPASREQVLEFYRREVGKKWGKFEDRGASLVIEDPAAPIKSLTVTAARDGSRLFIARRPKATE